MIKPQLVVGAVKPQVSSGTVLYLASKSAVHARMPTASFPLE